VAGVARQSNEARLAEVHADGLRDFDDAYASQSKVRELCVEDREFATVPGKQWDGFDELSENRPRHEFNLVRNSCLRILKEYRNNRITSAFVSPDGAPDDKLADACASRFRADEKDSSATEAYDTAFDEGVMGGIGGWRLRTTYEDKRKDAGPQRIQFEAIPDADLCVYYDPNSNLQDKSDAMFCFVLSSLTRAAYARRFGDNSDPSSWPKGEYKSTYNWTPDKKIVVADYYRVEEARDTVRVFAPPIGEEISLLQSKIDEDPEIEQALFERGFREIPGRAEKIKSRKIRQYVMNGSRVVEEYDIPGEEIPVVLFFGLRWFIRGVEHAQGHIRLAKDAQRLLNSQLSMLADFSLSQSPEKPIVSPAMIKGWEHYWETDNVKRFAFLILNPPKDELGNELPIPELNYTKQQSVPAVTAALLQITTQAIRDILGNPENGEKVLSHVAGKTMEMVQQRIDEQAAIYFDNMAKAIRRSGQIWMSMASAVYVEKDRKLKGIGKRGEVTQIQLMQPSPRVGPDGTQLLDNDFTRAAFDVEVAVGPSSESKRQAIFRQVSGMLPSVADPQMQTMLLQIALANLDGEGVDSFRKAARMKLLRSGDLDDPTEEEARKLAAEKQSATPDAQTAYLLAEAEKAKANAIKAQADTALIAAQTEKTQAETVETLAGIDIAHQSAAVETARSINEIVNTLASPGLAPEGPGRDL
jgi:hypothetical protein